MSIELNAVEIGSSYVTKVIGRSVIEVHVLSRLQLKFSFQSFSESFPNPPHSIPFAYPSTIFPSIRSFDVFPD